MKQLIIIGNIGADAVCRTCADGTQLLTFNVAVSNRDSAEWFGVAYRYHEKLLPYLVKGQSVFVQGAPRFGVYNNRPDITINADRIELIGSARRDEPTAQTQAAAGGALAADRQTAQPTQGALQLDAAPIAPDAAGHYN